MTWPEWQAMHCPDADFDATYACHNEYLAHNAAAGEEAAAAASAAAEEETLEATALTAATEIGEEGEKFATWVGSYSMNVQDTLRNTGCNRGSTDPICQPLIDEYNEFWESMGFDPPPAGAITIASNMSPDELAAAAAGLQEANKDNWDYYNTGNNTNACFNEVEPPGGWPSGDMCAPGWWQTGVSAAADAYISANDARAEALAAAQAAAAQSVGGADAVWDESNADMLAARNGILEHFFDANGIPIPLGDVDWAAVYEDVATEVTIAPDQQITIGQCFLLNVSKRLSSGYKELLDQSTQSNIFPRNGKIIRLNTKNPGGVISKLKGCRYTNAIKNLTPRHMSTMIPVFKIYKVLYTSSRTGDTIDIPINFNQNEKVGEDFKSAFEEGIVHRGFGVGVKSFNWNYVGTNPAAATKDITADLNLFANNFGEFLKEREYIYIDGAESKTIVYRIIDLILHPVDIDAQTTAQSNSPAPNVVFDARDFKIRAEVGWKIPRYAYSMFIDDIKELKSDEDVEALQECLREVLFLTLVDHTINIQENGSVNLSISYRAYSEESIKGPEFNVLYPTSMTMMRFEVLQDRHLGALNICERLEDEELDQVTDKVDEVQRKYEEALGNIKYEGYKQVINNLIGRNRVFSMSVEKAKIMQARIEGRSLVEVLGTSGTAATTLGPTATNVQPATQSDLEQITEQAMSYFNNEDYMHVHFFFLGDLLDTVYDHAYTRSDRPLDLKIVLPTIPYRSYLEDGKLINLAHIPISVDFYNEWIATNIISLDVSTYSLADFIRELCQTLITRILGRECEGSQFDEVTRLEIGFLKGLNASPGVGPFAALNVPDYNFDIDNDSFTGILSLSEAAETTSNIQSNMVTHYLIVYCSNAFFLSEKEINTFEERREHDENNGIVYFNIGSKTGIVKSINFSKNNIPGLREARFEQYGLSTPLSQLSNVYNASIKLYGVPNFYPGDRVYIEPFAMGVGYPWEKPSGDSVGSPAWALGIGGYHIIVEAKSSISRGEFSTTLECRWESSDGVKRLFDWNSEGSATIDQEAASLSECIDELDNFIDNPDPLAAVSSQ